MNKKDLDSLARKLRRQRNRLFQEVAATEADLRFIEEDRESELEERAQEESTVRLLARLDDQGKREIEEIDAALHRIATGDYGTCEECGRRIPRARLRAVPAARVCVRCARVHETPPSVVAEEEPRRPRPLPADLSSLSDRELAKVIGEHVRDDGRIDMEELRIVCRKGVVYLEGVLPSTAEHSILLRLLTDVMGLEEIGDYLQIKQGPWEREDRSKAERAAQPIPGVEPYGTEDIVKSTEEGIDYVPPVGPTPEEE